MTLFMIMLVIMVHWFADFVVQTDWQARNKSTNNIALARHVGTYSLCLTFFAFCVSIFFNAEFPWAIWVILNAVLHFVTDYITSRMTSYLWKQGRVHDFFVVVGFDQVIHYACLFGTLFYFGGM